MIRAVSTPELEISAKRLHARSRSRVSSTANSRRVSVRTDFEVVENDGAPDQSTNQSVKRWSFTRKRRARTPDVRRNRQAISATSVTSYKSEPFEPKTTKTALLRQKAVEQKRAAAVVEEESRTRGMKRPSPAPRRKSLEKSRAVESDQADPSSQSSNLAWSNAPIDKNDLKLDFRGLHSDEEPSAARYAAEVTSLGSAEATASSVEEMSAAAPEEEAGRQQSPAEALGNILRSTVDLATGYQTSTVDHPMTPPVDDSRPSPPVDKPVAASTPSRKIAAYSRRSRSSKDSDHEPTRIVAYHPGDNTEKSSKPPTPPSATGSVSSSTSKKLASYRRSRLGSRENVTDDQHPPVRTSPGGGNRKASEDAPRDPNREKEPQTAPPILGDHTPENGNRAMQDGSSPPTQTGGSSNGRGSKAEKAVNVSSHRVEEEEVNSKKEPIEPSNSIRRSPETQNGKAASGTDGHLERRTSQGSQNGNNANGPPGGSKAAVVSPSPEAKVNSPPPGSKHEPVTNSHRATKMPTNGEASSKQEHVAEPVDLAPKPPIDSDPRGAVQRAGPPPKTAKSGDSNSSSNKSVRHGLARNIAREALKSALGEQRGHSGGDPINMGKKTSDDIDRSELEPPAVDPFLALWAVMGQAEKQLNGQSGNDQPNADHSSPNGRPKGSIPTVQSTTPTAPPVDPNGPNPSHVHPPHPPSKPQSHKLSKSAQSTRKDPIHRIDPNFPEAVGSPDRKPSGQHSRSTPASVGSRRTTTKDQQQQPGTTRSAGEIPPALTPEKLDTIRKYLEEQSNADQDRMSDVHEAIALQKQSDRSEKKRRDLDPLYHLTLVIERITDEKRQLTDLCQQLLQQMQLTATKLLEIESRQEQSLLAFLPKQPYWNGTVMDDPESKSKSPNVAEDCAKCRKHEGELELLRREFEERTETMRSKHEYEIAELQKQAQRPSTIDNFAQTDEDDRSKQEDNDSKPTARVMETGRPLTGGPATQLPSPEMPPEHLGLVALSSPEQGDKPTVHPDVQSNFSSDTPSDPKFSIRFQDLQQENGDLKKQLENLQQRCDALTKVIKLG